MVEEWTKVNQFATRFEKVVNLGKLVQAQRSRENPLGTTHIRYDI
jgi:hypothetical protein